MQAWYSCLLLLLDALTWLIPRLVYIESAFFRSVFDPEQSIQPVIAPFCDIIRLCRIVWVSVLLSYSLQVLGYTYSAVKDFHVDSLLAYILRRRLDLTDGYLDSLLSTASDKQ